MQHLDVLQDEYLYEDLEALSKKFKATSMSSVKHMNSVHIPKNLEEQ